MPHRGFGGSGSSRLSDTDSPTLPVSSGVIAAFCRSVIATRTSAPRSRKRRTSSGVSYAAIPPLMPRNNFLPASHHVFFLLGDFERRIFYHNLYGVVSLPALHFARRYARTKSGRRSSKAVPLCRFLLKKARGALWMLPDELLPREKCSDPALLPSATWSRWRFYVPARRERWRRWQKRYCSIFGSLYGLLSADFCAVSRVNGIGPAKFAQLKGIAELAAITACGMNEWKVRC